MINRQRYIKRATSGFLIALIMLKASLLSGNIKPTANRLPPSIIDFEHITAKDGLVSQIIYDIVQDKKGFLWLGTANGISRYDGHGFKHYLPNAAEPNAIQKGPAIRVFFDSKNRLWITVQGGGLHQYDEKNDQFIIYKNDPEDPHSLSSNKVYGITEDDEGYLWISTIDQGINRFDEANNRFDHWKHDPNNPNSLSGNTNFSIFKDRFGDIWVDATGISVNRYNIKEDRWYHYMKGTRQVSWFMEDHLGDLWLSTYDGLVRFDRQKNSFHNYRYDEQDPYSIGKNLVIKTVEDSKGTIWVSTWGGGLAAYDRANDRFVRYRHDPRNPKAVSSDNLWGLYEDRSGVMWFGTYGAGLNKYDRKQERFSFLRPGTDGKNGLNHPNVKSIVETKQGDTWIGTLGGGLNRYNPITGTFKYYTHDPKDETSLSNNSVWGIAEDADGDLWIATEWGLNLYQGKTNSFKRFYHVEGEPDSLKHNIVRTVFVDYSNNVWIGLQLGGVDRFDKQSNRFIHYPMNGVFSNVIFQDSKRNLWVGNGLGLYRYIPQTDTFLLQNKGFTIAIAEDNHGDLWIGTTGGIFKYQRKDGTFEDYSEKSGLAHTEISAIIPDEQGTLWISTPFGITAYHPEKESSKFYEIAVFNRGAYLKGQNNNLFFGSENKGLVSFDPGEIKENPFLPPIVLTSFKKFNQEVQFNRDVSAINDIVLDYEDRFFSFEFAALDFSNPSKNRYRYKLEGFDQDWIDLGTESHVAGYTNLDGGNYKFRVMASNSDGVWNREGLAVNLKIIPPYWKTWWFYSLLVAAGVVLILLIIFYVIQLRNQISIRIRTENELKESEIKFRTLVNSAPYGIQLTDLEGKIIYSNPAHHQIQGYRDGELNGKYIWDLIASEEQKSYTRNYYKQLVAEQPPPVLYETIDKTNDGRLINTQVNWAYIRNEKGNLESIISIISDVTAQRRVTDQLNTSLKEKEILLQEVHHRVKNNMQVIASLLRLQLNRKDKQDVDTILKENIGRVFAMATIHENLHQSDTLSEIDFNSYLQKLARMMLQTYLANPGNIHFQIEASDLKLNIEKANPLGLVINELISNSLKYAFPDDKKGTISIKTQILDKGDIELVIRDNGIGMPPGFDWNSIDSLGLILVREIVENQLDGAVDYQNNNGTQFTITFNLESN